MNINTYSSNREESDKLDPIVKKQLSKIFKVSESSITYNLDKDQKEATDFTLTKPDGTKIDVGIRFRDFSYLTDFPDQFTIRSGNGNKRLEFEKIMDGHCDYILYQFRNREKTGFVKATIIDVNVFRKELKERAEYFAKKSPVIPNDDGTNFRAFCVKDFIGKIVFLERQDDNAIAENNRNFLKKMADMYRQFQAETTELKNTSTETKETVEEHDKLTLEEIKKYIEEQLYGKQ